MQKLKFKWVRKTGKYQTGEVLFLGRVCVASYEWNAGRPQGQLDRTWIGHVLLPGLAEQSKTLYGEDTTEMKSRIQGIVTSWFDEQCSRMYSDCSKQDYWSH